MQIGHCQRLLYPRKLKMLTCLFKCQRFLSVSPLPIVFPPSGGEKTLKGPLPKWPPSSSVSSSSAHFGPSGISVPLQSASSDLTRRSCNCLPPASTTTKKTKLFESDKVVNFSPSWKTQNFCECWKARRLLLVELLTVKSSLFSCNFQTLLLLCSTSHCFVRLSKEKQLCRHLPSPSSFLPLPRSSTGTLCHLTAPAHHSCCLQHSPLLIQSSFFVWAALRNHLFSIYFIAIWAFSDLFPHLFPPILILSFLFHCGGCF